MREFLDSIKLVDHHCHGVTTVTDGVAGFEQHLTEARVPMWFGQRYVDTPLGVALMANCPAVLDFDERPTIEAYLQRREELGEQEVMRRFLSAAGLSALIVDTGYAGEETTPENLGDMAGCPSHVVHRVETIAEGILASGGSSYLSDLRKLLRRAAETGVGFKSVLAYRGGLDLLTEPPDEAEIDEAAARIAGQGGPLVDELLLRNLLFETLAVASETGQPIQFHIGYGDDDLDLAAADPLLLEPFIGQARDREVPVVLLHCYPFQREAGFLASVYPNVFFDVGLAIPHVGLEGERILAEALEVAPFAKLLYSSDAARLPEFFFLASRLFRRAADLVFTRWIEADLMPEGDAERFLGMIASGNAHRVYSGLGAR